MKGKVKRHPINGYSQGMNDILAPIFMVVLEEYKSKLKPI